MRHPSCVISSNICIVTWRWSIVKAETCRYYNNKRHNLVVFWLEHKTLLNNILVQLLLLCDFKRQVLTFALYFCDCGLKTVGLMELLCQELQLAYVLYQPMFWRKPSTVCSRHFPGRPTANVDNMEDIVSQEEVCAPPFPDVKFGDRFMSVFLFIMGKFWTWDYHMLDSVRRRATEPICVIHQFGILDNMF